jgi:hypothetical protein
MGVYAATKTIVAPMFNGNRLDWCRTWSEDCGKPAADAYCRNQGFQEAASFAREPHIGALSPTRLIGTGATCDLAHCDGFRQITCLKQPTVADMPAKPVAVPRDRPEETADAPQKVMQVATTAPMRLTPATEERTPKALSPAAAPAKAPPAEAQDDAPAETASIAATAPTEATDDAKAATKQFDKPMYNGKRLAWCHDFTTECGKPAADAFCKANGFGKAADFTQDPHIGDMTPTRSMGNGAVCDQAPCDGFKAITCAM